MDCLQAHEESAVAKGESPLSSQDVIEDSLTPGITQRYVTILVSIGDGRG